MPELIRPTPAVHASFLAAMAEFQAEGRGDASDDSMVGREIREYRATWDSLEGFERYLRNLLAEAVTAPPGWVLSTTLWWVEGAAYLGRLAIRHELTPILLEGGGHIGYDVPPSARRQGHATAMLAAALPIAYQLGIESALVTCDTSNVASRKVIEANGGKLEDERHGKLRFWVPTHP
jgi:predicted acetyltransferase